MSNRFLQKGSLLYTNGLLGLTREEAPSGTPPLLDPLLGGGVKRAFIRDNRGRIVSQRDGTATR